MDEIKLFDKVECNGYIVKNKEYKKFEYSDSLYNIIEDDKITLGKDGSFYIDLYILKERNFKGFVAGIYKTYKKRKFSNENMSIYYYKVEPFKVAKVYYANNKSRIVPLENCRKI